MRDISLSGYIFTRLRLVKIWPPAREISRLIYSPFGIDVIIPPQVRQHEHVVPEEGGYSCV